MQTHLAYSSLSSFSVLAGPCETSLYDKNKDNKLEIHDRILTKCRKNKKWDYPGWVCPVEYNFLSFLE